MQRAPPPVGYPWPPTPTRPGSVVAASLLTIAAGFFWLLVSLLQFFAFIVDNAKTEIALTAIWNMTLTGLFVWIAWGLWHGNPKALSWARWTHFLDVGLCAYQGFTDAPLVVLVIPVHLLAGVASLMIKPAQSQAGA